MIKIATFILVIFSVICVQEFVSAQNLEGTWERTITLTTECPSLPPVTETFTDTVTYNEFDTTIELPEEYQNCELESNGNEWSLDCTYDQELDLCVYHFHLQGSGGWGEEDFNFQFTAEYTVTGGLGCELIPLCVVTGEIQGARIQTTAIDGEHREEMGIPGSFGLFQNYPNPFNPFTTISYAIPSREQRAESREYALRTTLKVYNILGQEIRTLVDETTEAGYYTVTWDGRDGHGVEVASGFYFYRLEAGGFSATRCMLLLK